MKTIKLTAPVKDYIWGGTKLRDYGIVSDKARLAEAWVLSMHPDGTSQCEDGRLLSDVVTAADLGKNCEKFEFFPVLVKLIDANDNLSVQVHPSDEYALKNEGQFGKTEMWYVVDHDEGAGLYVGFKRDVSCDEYKNAIADGTVLNLLNFFKVKKGDCFFIPSGTVHAIGKGCTIAEVQQNSNLTYRVFDFNRVGVDGKPRELHVDKAVLVSDLGKYNPEVLPKGYLSDCKYFTVIHKKGGFALKRDDSFTGLTVISGSGTVDGIKASKGDTFFVPATHSATITGDDIELMEVFVR